MNAPVRKITEAGYLPVTTIMTSTITPILMKGLTSCMRSCITPLGTWIVCVLQECKQLRLLVKLLRQLITWKSMVIVSITSCVSYSRRCNVPCEARDPKGATIPKGIKEIARCESTVKRRIEGGCLLLLG
jgi:hypothetical protein